MRHQDRWVPDGLERRGLLGYESPRVEQVLTPEELEREILYAGLTQTAMPPPP